jgi:hypothetical protein
MVSSSSSEVVPSGEGLIQNNASVVGDHGQPDPIERDQVTDEIETADKEQGTTER